MQDDQLSAENRETLDIFLRQPIRWFVATVVGLGAAFGLAYLTIHWYSPPLTHPVVLGAMTILYFILDMGIFLALGSIVTGGIDTTRQSEVSSKPDASGDRGN